MIFSELYSAYYNAVAAILSRAVAGVADRAALTAAVNTHAFAESVLTILPALEEERWPLLYKDGTTPLLHSPTMPLTLLQKRWLKAVLQDPRVRLFDLAVEGLDDVEPLFGAEDYVVYDRYADGDPYGDEGYVRRFRQIVSALQNGQALRLQTVNRKGRVLWCTMLPERLEYSEKDDKFRLIGRGSGHGITINLARVLTCEIARGTFVPCEATKAASASVTLRVTDERNALERCLLHFAYFEKRVERVDARHYLLHITYDPSDETELVIRTLSFGPLVEAVAPDAFRALIVERLRKQKSCEL